MILPVSITIGVIYCAIVLFVSWNSYNLGGFGVETDFYWDYAPAADAFWKGDFPWRHLQFRGPGYPLILSGLGWLGDTFLAGRLISGISSAVVVGVFCYLLIERFGLVLGLAGCSALILNGIFFEYSIRVGTDMFFLMLNILVIFLLGTGKSPAAAISAGFISGLAFLTRYNGIAIVATLLLWVLLSSIKDFQREWKRALGGMIGCIVPILIWMTISYQYGDSVLPKSNIYNILYEIKAPERFGWEEYWYGNKTPVDSESIWKDSNSSGQIAGYALGNLKENLIDDGETLTGNLLLSLSLAGIMVLLFRQRNAGIWFWGITAGAFNYLSLLFVFHSPRFSLCILPIYIVTSLFFLDWFFTKIRSNLRIINYGKLVILSYFVISVSIPRSWSYAMKRIENSPNYLLQYVEDIKHLNLPKDEMTARKPHFAYLMGLPFRVLPILNNSEELLNWMKTNDIAYLFLSSHDIGTRPQLAGLLGNDCSIDGLERIAHWETPVKAVIWKRLQVCKESISSELPHK